MSEEAPPSALRIFLSRHAEKLGLGAAVAALLAYLVLGVFTGGENKSASEVRASAERIDAESRSEHKNLKAPTFPERTELRDNREVKVVDELHDLEVLKYWEKLPSDGALAASADWTASLLTRGEEHKIPYEKPTETPILMPTVSLDKAETRLDGVTISWTVKEPKSSDEKPIDVVKPETLTLLIERLNPGTNKTETFTVKEPKSSSYSDKTVEKRTKYRYRLILVTSDALYKERTSTDRTSPTKWHDVSTLDIWDLAFTNPIPAPKEKPDEKGYVFIKIVKFDKVAGQVEVSHKFLEGEKIGWWLEKWKEKVVDQFGRESEVDKEAVISKHKINVNGRMFEVDFDTKMTLTSVKEIPVKLTRKKCDPKYDKGTGVLKSCDLVDDPHEIRVKEIVWTDEDSKPQTKLEPDPADNPLGKDYLSCQIHKPVAADPDREAKQKAERDARDLLANAQAKDKAYRDGMKKAENLDKDPKKTEEAKKVREEAQKDKGTAVELYEKFLNDCKETFVYKENKRKVEDARDKLKK